MRLLALILASAIAATTHAQSPFTLQQVLSAPYASNLIAAPAGNLFAWVEDAEGRHNLYIGGPNTPARALTHNTVDNGQDITGLAWSPDASAIAYTYGAETGADGHPANPAHLQHPTPVQVIVQPLALNTKPLSLGEGHSPLFTRDGHSIFFVRAGQIFVACINDCHPERSEGPVSPEPPIASAHQLVFDRGSASSLTLSPNGHTLAFISRRNEVNEPSHRFLALFDIPSHTLTFPAPSTSNDSAPAFSPDGKNLAWIRSPFTQTPEFAPDRTSPNPWSIQLLDLNPPSICNSDQNSSVRQSERSEESPHFAGTGTGTSATSASPICTARTLFSPEPNKPGSVLPHMATGAPRLFYTSDDRIIFTSEADGWVHLYALDPNSPKPPTLLTPGAFEVDDPIINNDGKLLVWSSNQQTLDPQDVDRRHIWQLNVTAPGESPKYRTSGRGIESRPALAADGSTLAALASGIAPIHPVLIGPNASQTPLTESAVPTYPATSLIALTQILIPSTDNLTLHAQLFLPRFPATGHTRHPAILFLHGGPRRQMLLGYPSGEYYSNAYAFNQYLTSLGFIVLSVNYRCGTGYGLDFRQCLNAGATGAAEYADVLAAQHYLASRPDVDPARIGIWGGSYGGYLTALALARNSNLFAAGVDFHGVHDWNLEDNASDWKFGTFAQQDAIAAKALASSPLADITHWTSPILLIHGDSDPEVAYAETPILAEALRARNAILPPAKQIDVEDLIFPDEVHGFLLHKDWLAAYSAAAAFFIRTLEPNH